MALRMDDLLEEASLAREAKLAAEPAGTVEVAQEGRPATTKWWKTVKTVLIMVLSGLILGLVGIGILGVWQLSHPETNTAVAPAITIEETTVTAGDASGIVGLMADNGWASDEYVTGDAVDPTVDNSTAGQGAYTAERLQSPQQIVAFLGSEKPGARALLAAVMTATKATREEVMDVSNWTAVQSLIEFQYDGNTGFDGVTIIDAGARSGSAGDIFLVFISPGSHLAVAVRGACGNAQVIFPHPHVTDDGDGKDPSQDPAATGNAVTGAGTNIDPGPGAYVPPTSMVHPPSTPYVAPPPPVNTGEPIGSTPDPTPAPAPEPSVPTTTDPATGDSSAPGR